jgi:hypothetical protein
MNQELGGSIPRGGLTGKPGQNSHGTVRYVAASHCQPAVDVFRTRFAFSQLDKEES